MELFIEAETKLNKTIIENLSSKPINGNGNITEAVRAVLEDANFEPFPKSSEMYEISDGGRSLKTTYGTYCLKSTRRRCCIVVRGHH